MASWSRWLLGPDGFLVPMASWSRWLLGPDSSSHRDLPNSYLPLIFFIYAITFLFSFPQLLLIFYFIIKALRRDAPSTSPSPSMGASNPPTPPPSSTPQTQLTLSAVVQFSCNGILHCMQELSSLLHSMNMLIACKGVQTKIN